MFRVKATIIIFLMAHGIFAPNLSQALTPGLGNPDCSSLLLVSSWSKNNVKIYDGCDGHYIRDLDSQKLIEGPLGILLAPDGDLLVISETNGRLLKYDQQTLSRGVVVMGDNPETPVVEDNFIATPSAAILDDKGMMYAASFGSNSVVKIDTSIWKITEQLVKLVIK